MVSLSNYEGARLRLLTSMLQDRRIDLPLLRLATPAGALERKASPAPSWFDKLTMRATDT